MPENHFWSRKSHNFFYFFSVFGFVAMRIAFLTSGFVFFIFTFIGAENGIINQVFTIFTNSFATMICFAVNLYHRFNSSFFSFYFFTIHQYVKIRKNMTGFENLSCLKLLLIQKQFHVFIHCTNSCNTKSINQNFGYIWR